MHKVSNWVFIIPLFVAAVVVTGAFVYKSMISSPRASEPKNITNPVVPLKVPSGKPNSGFGTQPRTAPPTVTPAVQQSGTTSAVLNALSSLSDTTLDTELDSIATDTSSL